jgi:uncharacterized membrane protein
MCGYGRPRPYRRCVAPQLAVSFQVTAPSGYRAVQSSAMDEMDEPNQPPDSVPPAPEHNPEPSQVPPPMPVWQAAATPVSPFYEPTQDERTFATLAHALQMPGWWIAPLIILLTRKESRFVKFHATQALLLQCLHIMVTITTMVIFFAFLFGSIVHAGAQKAEPPAALFVFMPFIWLVMFGMYVLILVLSIVYAIKAGKGEWANYPLLGHLARYMLNL